MTYDAIETSAQDGHPVELYEFLQGATHSRFTSWASDYSYGGHTFTANGIGRNEISVSDELNKAGLQVTFPRNNTFAYQLLTQCLEVVTLLTIWRGHAGDADGEFVAFWKGRVAGAQADGPGIALNCESVFTSLRRPGLRARYQRMCRHTLYGRGCNLDKEDWGVAGTVGAVDGVSLTVAAAADQADGWYNGGMVGDASGALRFILAHVGSNLTLSRPFADLAVSDSITLYPGCEHTNTVCHDKFDNLPNMGGCPYMPTKNPFGFTSIV